MRASPDKLDFTSRLQAVEPAAGRAERIDWLMLNVGLRCDAACGHCHHSCSPRRTESMSRETMEGALALAEALLPETIDITGGAPEAWPLLDELVERAKPLVPEVRVRTNLQSLSGAPELAELYARHRVTILASLPGTSAAEVAPQRGATAFERSLGILSRLMELGYGMRGGPRLEIAYNPPVGSLPADEAALTARFGELLSQLSPVAEKPSVGVLAITNVPLGRAREALERDGVEMAYLHRLADRFDAANALRLACRHGIEVGFDGRLYDCDFNLAAGLPTADGPATVAEALADPDAVARRTLAFGRHCFACTAASGSS